MVALFDAVLSLVCKYFIEKLCVYDHQKDCFLLLLYLYLVFLSGNSDLIRRIWKYAFL